MFNTSQDNEKLPQTHTPDTPGTRDDLQQLFLPVIDFKKACKFVKSMIKRFEQVESRLLFQGQAPEEQREQLEQYFLIVSECQKQTAAFANNQLEQHRLYPAVEAVDYLNRIIGQIYSQTKGLSQTQIQCPLFTDLINAITQARQIAIQKCQSLDIEPIVPEQGRDFDPQRHEIKNAVKTNDTKMHRKICKVLKPGLLYCGRVLRQANVTVYRYSEN
jgi:molecular chaperone GrpE (heat shock protein)